MSVRMFWVTFEIADRLLADHPELADEARRDIETRTEVRGPRGGRYVLVGPVDRWEQSRDHGDAFTRGVTVIGGRRPARYVRPR